MSDFSNEFRALQRNAHNISKAKGFYPPGQEVNLAEKVALIHSEASELLEAYRDGSAKLPSAKAIPVFGGRMMTNEEEELADLVIRVMDLAQFRGLVDLGAAIVAKVTYNATRPHKHGKQF